MICLEGITFNLKARGVPVAERMRTANELVEIVGLRGFEDKYPTSSPAACDNGSASRALSTTPQFNEFICIVLEEIHDDISLMVRS